MTRSSCATSRSHQGDRQRPIIAIWLVGLAGAAFARSAVGVELPSTIDEVVVELAVLSLALTSAWWAANVVVLTVALQRGRPLPSLQLPGARRVAQGLLILTMSTSCVVDDDAPRMVFVGAAEAAATATSTTIEPPTTIAPTTTGAPTTAAPTAPSTSAPSSTVPSTDVDDGADQSAAADDDAPSIDESDPAQESNGSMIAEHQVVVRPGDNLWSMAEATLVANGIDDPTCAEITDYWRQVVAANRVQSGDPNLIVPGETITMPAHELVSAATARTETDATEFPTPVSGSAPYGFHHR